jgi:hypothetical protein
MVALSNKKLMRKGRINLTSTGSYLRISASEVGAEVGDIPYLAIPSPTTLSSALWSPLSLPLGLQNDSLEQHALGNSPTARCSLSAFN